MASQELSFGKFRVNGVKVKKSAEQVKRGDVIVFSLGNKLRAVKVTELSHRRGSSFDACKLYQDLCIDSLSV